MTQATRDALTRAYSIAEDASGMIHRISVVICADAIPTVGVITEVLDKLDTLDDILVDVQDDAIGIRLARTMCLFPAIDSVRGILESAKARWQVSHSVVTDGLEAAVTETAGLILRELRRAKAA